MLDSLRKRCVFLEAAVDQLQLTNATVLWARAEDAGQSTSFREVGSFLKVSVMQSPGCTSPMQWCCAALPTRMLFIERCICALEAHSYDFVVL